jgi:hypothetical protein
VIHAKMTKPRKTAPTAITKKTAKKEPPIVLKPGKAPAGPVSIVKAPPVGTVVEVMIDGLWWPGKVESHGTFRMADLFRVRVFDGATSPFAVVNSTCGDVWRIANRLHSVPRTRQGVRNLDMAAPPRFRNGRKFRKPKHFEAICSHPEEALSEEPIEEEVEGLDENRERYTYVLRFLECADCGAEVSI